MNWYKVIKIAQIWKIEESNDFHHLVYQLYEMEYKLHMLRNKKFNGLPRRHENLVDNVERSLLTIINKIKPILERVFFTWLENHALLDPTKWAERRVINTSDAESSEDFLFTALAEYKDYLNDKRPWLKFNEKITWTQLLQELLNTAGNLDLLPSLEKIKKYYEDDQKEYMNDLLEDGLSSFKAEYDFNDDIETEEAAKQYINSFEYDDYTFLDLYSESLIEDLEMFGSLQSLAQEIYQNFTFPEWYRYWLARGIDETRYKVEKAYKALQKASSIKENIVAINLAINTYHQNGSMMDYIEDYGGTEQDEDTNSKLNILTEDLLTNLSEGIYNEEWDEDLKEVGLEV